MNRSMSTSRLATVLGLAVGATGCAILWAAGAVPFSKPLGMIIMGAGALFVGWAPFDRRSDRDVQGAPGPCRRKPLTPLLPLKVNGDYR